jgi:hypothetical protein
VGKYPARAKEWVENMNYFVISVSEDGDVSVRRMSRQQILKDLNDENSGLKAEKVFEGNPKESDPNYWEREGKDTVIIKGELVSPKAIKIVEKYEIE